MRTDDSRRRVILDRYRSDDEPVFTSWCSDPTAFSFLRKSATDAESPSALFNKLASISQVARGHHRIWAVRLRAEPLLVGHAELKATEKTGPDEAEAVLFIAGSHRRIGYGREAIAAVLDEAGATQGIDSVLAVCRPSNEPSIRIITHAGFTLTQMDPTALWFRWSAVSRAQSG